MRMILDSHSIYKGSVLLKSLEGSSPLCVKSANSMYLAQRRLASSESYPSQDFSAACNENGQGLQGARGEHCHNC